MTNSTTTPASRTRTATRRAAAAKTKLLGSGVNSLVVKLKVRVPTSLFPDCKDEGTTTATSPGHSEPEVAEPEPKPKPKKRGRPRKPSPSLKTMRRTEGHGQVLDEMIETFTEGYYTDLEHENLPKEVHVHEVLLVACGVQVVPLPKSLMTEEDYEAARILMDFSAKAHEEAEEAAEAAQILESMKLKENEKNSEGMSELISGGAEASGLTEEMATEYEYEEPKLAPDEPGTLTDLSLEENRKLMALGREKLMAKKMYGF
ncbi:hypothetical protein M8818_003299 [Zalaria obscura]|uniref:Uncharacterized protein n=1 Tax=Zalaria obscura TaxID=2024903 RepID=A0ACC3SFC3_9PEZI